MNLWDWIQEWSGPIGIGLGLLGIGLTIWYASRHKETNPIWYFITGVGVTLLSLRITRASRLKDLDKVRPKTKTGEHDD